MMAVVDSNESCVVDHDLASLFIAGIQSGGAPEDYLDP